MLKQITLYVALISLAMVGASLAQTPEKPDDFPMPPVIESPEDVAVVKDTVVFGEAVSRPDAARPTQALLTEIVTWLSTNFDLPAIQDLPRVEFVSPAKLASMRYKGFLPDRSRQISVNEPAVETAHQREVVAVYNDTMKTIFLSEAWTGTTPAELSVLVHEMVHHLQNLGQLKFECPGAREKPAYLAQNQWLKQFGQDLEKEFEIDLFTILVKSACMN